MGFSEPTVVCMKHPNHKQTPGVCSCCLRERLSKISGPSSMAVSSSSGYYYYHDCSPSNVSYSGSECSSAAVSPPRRGGGRHHRIASDVLVSFSFISSKSVSELKKSRSIAFVTGRVNDGLKGNKKPKKKGGFWAKILKSTSKRTK